MASIDSFENDNSSFEAWLAKQCDIDQAGLDEKHAKMADDPFPFLRATYFRWARTIEQRCPKLKDAPRVLAVGDIHIENFGTWRNVEQRLVWGINDFDEAARMPYAFDLVRLVTSARLAPRMKLRPKTIARAVLDGYRFGLKRRHPTLLDQRQTWMNNFLLTTEKERADFREKLKKLETENDVPASARRGLLDALPKGVTPERFARRRAGVGSLGRPRFVAIAEWHGGLVVREAKAQVPSAWDWAHGRGDAPSKLIDAARSASRSPDPYLEADGKFVFRRIAADADKIELKNLDRDALQTNLFGAMGFDLGVFHAGSRAAAAAIKDDLSRRRDGWLHEAADHAEEQVVKDFGEWRKLMKTPGRKRKKTKKA